ncbi:MAG TPA: AAA family ATPase [Kofleriaceae bacterium]|nr:AAA family ATPase [Kofleriaceae bacterium]
MSHTFTIPVYQRKLGDQLEWFTLGLGKHGHVQRGKSRVKLQRKLVEYLRATISKAPLDALVDMTTPRGIELRRVWVDLTVRSATGRTRVAGRIPVICEPRWTTETEQRLIVYHPLQQDAWFTARLDEDLAAIAALFFRHAWDGLEEVVLLGLESDGKDSLRRVSLSAQPLDPTLELKQRKKGAPKRVPEEVLSRIGADQTLRAIEQTLPTGMPRQPYRQQLQLLLCGTRKRPTIVVGPPGVGKSTVLHQWIADLLATDGWELHRNLDRIHHVWRISGKRIIAGMSHLGDWEQRCLDLMDQARRKRAVLWVEDLHLFGRLGETRQSERDLADFFRGPVTRGDLLMVGECTPEQLQRLEDDAPSFASLFTRVRVSETTTAETLQMMLHAGRQVELERPVELHPFTYRSIIELGAGVFPWSAFPGKALELLRQLAARAPMPPSGERTPLAPSDVVGLLSHQTGLPENLLTLDARLDLREVRQSLSRLIMGQPEAVEAACDLIARIRAGLGHPGRPHAVYLFTGPTGTGKTELAKCIAEYLYGSQARLLRYDMSEYSTPDAVPRLIGDRHTPDGQLTQRIREQPFSVVLLDEIEKAHPSVLYLLLQLFDEARLTDAAGDVANFQQAVIIMTSNLGARPTRPIGFGEDSRGILADVARAVREFFPPELFNRIDRVVPFQPLSAEAAEGIATKELARMLGRRGLTDRNIYVYANRTVKQTIVAEAFDARLGARTVKRYLEDHIGSLLADEITRAARASMQVVRIYDADGALRLHVDPLVEAAPEPAALPLEALLDLPAAQLREPAVQAGARLRAAIDGGLIERTLARARDDAQAADLFYFADVYRDRVQRLARRLGGGAKQLARVSQPDLLAMIADVELLLRNGPHVADLARHQVWVDLVRLGHGDASDRLGDAAAGAGLIDWLVGSYVEARPDELDGFGCRYRDGRVMERVGEDAAGELPGALARRPVQVTLSIGGLFAADVLAGERGCHIWRSLSSEPEIVRVDVSPGAGAIAPRSRLDEHQRGVREFEAALERGAEPLPPNPQALTPAVRALSFRPPLRQGEVFPVEVEDFRLGFAARLDVTGVERALGILALLWRGRVSQDVST